MSQTGNLTAGFIDLATYGEMEAKLYGGRHAITYFVRATRKCSWFTQVPVHLTSLNGTPGFDQTWSVGISRAGDYLLQTWLNTTVKDVVPSDDSGSGSTLAAAAGVVMARNFMHSLMDEVYLTFNDLVAERFDNSSLDFWTAFTMPSEKKAVYESMIGAGYHETLADGSRYFMNGLRADTEDHELTLPLPFFYSRDTGIALPTAALPYNDMKITFKTRSTGDLFTFPTVPAASGTGADSTFAVSNIPFTGTAKLDKCELWANYALVTNDERTLMGAAPRDIVIEQHQMAQPVALASNSTHATVGEEVSKDIRFAHSVKALFFGVRNSKTNYKQQSCVSGLQTLQTADTFKCTPYAGYGSKQSGQVYGGLAGAGNNHATYSRFKASANPVGQNQQGATRAQAYYFPAEVDNVIQGTTTGKPYSIQKGANYATAVANAGGLSHAQTGLLAQESNIDTVDLIYENTYRLGTMKSRYFETIEPYYKSVSTGDTGMCMYSYGLDVNSLDPDGSTNYGKLTNVKLTVKTKDHHVSSTVASDIGAQELVVTAVNWNIIRVSGGALGFPVL